MYHSSGVGRSISECGRDCQMPPNSFSPLGKNKNKIKLLSKMPGFKSQQAGSRALRLCRVPGVRRVEVRKFTCRSKCEGPVSLVCVLQTAWKQLELQSRGVGGSRGFRTGWRVESMMGKGCGGEASGRLVQSSIEMGET